MLLAVGVVSLRAELLSCRTVAGIAQVTVIADELKLDVDSDGRSAAADARLSVKVNHAMIPRLLVVTRLKGLSGVGWDEVAMQYQYMFPLTERTVKE
jgi:hypothetical protein